MTSQFRAFAALAGAAVVAVPALGQSYTAVELPAVAGDTVSWAIGVSDAGVAVGTSGVVVLVPNGPNPEDLEERLVLKPVVWEGGSPVVLPDIPNGVGEGMAVSVNASGLVVGHASVAGFDPDPNDNIPPGRLTHAAIWRKDAGGVWQVTDLSAQAGGVVGEASRVNNAGVVVGMTGASAYPFYRAFHWFEGTLTDLGLFGVGGPAPHSWATGVSADGRISAFAYSFGSPDRGFVLDGPGARETDTTPPGRFSFCRPTDVNDSGAMCGWLAGSSVVGGGDRASLYDAGAWTQLPLLPDFTDSRAFAMNNAGAVVGACIQPGLPSVYRAFVSPDAATTIDLNTAATGLTGVMSEANDVNESGVIVGRVDTFAGPRAVVLTPTPSCPADVNADGAADVADIFAFLSLWFASDSDADWNRNAAVEVGDIFAYLGAWFAGCD